MKFISKAKTRAVVESFGCRPKMGDFDHLDKDLPGSMGLSDGNKT